MTQESVMELLQKTRAIIKAYQDEQQRQNQYAKNTGNWFNIFEIVGISTREVYMCRILAELLNPKGAHCQEAEYLNLFCKRFFPEKNINTGKVSVITEDLTKNLDEIGKEFRRIDIVIDEEDGHYIPIEVKINAREQQEQCADYLYSARKIYAKRHKNPQEAIICYLTKTGEMPVSVSFKDKESVKRISWLQIVDWLQECICRIDTIRKTPITEIMMQYKTAIEKFLNEDNNTMLDKNIIYMIINDEKIFESAQKIADNIDAAKQELWEKFVKEIKNIIKQKGYDEDKLVDKYPDKIAYAKTEPDSANIVQYNVIFNESGKILTNRIGYYRKDADNIVYAKKENKNQRKIIEFSDIIGADKLTEKAKECVSFLLG